MFKHRPLNTQGMIPTELLVSVCLIGGMLLMVTILIDKSVALQRSRDLLRTNHVQRILGAILEYQIDHAGDLPPGIIRSDTQAQMIAIPGQVCTNVCDTMPVMDECLDLTTLIPTYMKTLPQDPFFTELGPSGYYIYRHDDGKAITVGACNTEIEGPLEATR